MTKRVARFKGDKGVSAYDFIEYPFELEGGRNLQEDSENTAENFCKNYKNSEIGFEEYDATEIWGFSNAYKLTSKKGDGNYKAISRVENMEHDTWYTYSVYIKNVGEYDAAFYVQGKGDVYKDSKIKSEVKIKTGEEMRYEITFNRRGGYDWSQPIVEYLGDDLDYKLEIILGREKFEKGTKATPWTPAPEDLGLSYPSWATHFGTSFKEQGITAQQFVEYPSETEARSLWSHDDLSDEGGLIGYYNYEDKRSSGFYTVSASHELYKKDIAIQITMVPAYEYDESDLPSADEGTIVIEEVFNRGITFKVPEEMREAYILIVFIDVSLNELKEHNTDFYKTPISLEGGRNLARYSGRGFMDIDEFIWGGDRSHTTIEVKDGRESYYLEDNNYMRISKLPTNEGEYYTWSAYVRTNDDEDGSIRWSSYHSDESHYITEYFDVDDNWRRISFTFKAKYKSDLPHIYLSKVTDRSLYLSDVKFEKGESATPWTPAPEDLGYEYPDDIQSFGVSVSDEYINAPKFVQIPEDDLDYDLPDWI